MTYEKEYCEDFPIQDEEVFVYQNTQNLSPRKLQEQNEIIKEHLTANGYINGGGVSISLPMSLSGEHFREMMDYCSSHCISKIVVASQRDIAADALSLNRVLNKLCDVGLIVELADSGIVYAPLDYESDESMRME